MVSVQAPDCFIFKFKKCHSFLRLGKHVSLGSKNIWERRKDLEGIQLRVGLLQTKPFYQKEPWQELQDGSGFAMDLWKLLNEAINFTSSFGESNSHGKRNSTTRQFSGISGQLAKGNFDIAAVPMMMTFAREEHFGFLDSVLMTRSPLWYKIVKVGMG